MKLTTKLSVLLLGATLTMMGCEQSNSPNVTVRNVGVDFSGFYDNDGAPLTSSQTGAKITSLNLRQTGDRLEAVDNNGIIFKGTLGEVSLNDNGQASSIFDLNGRTTANGDVTISGTISGSENQGTMSGTWIEPTLFGNFFAEGQISTINTNSNGGSTNGTAGVSVSPSSATLTVDGQTQTFTASGGSGNYSWQNADGNKGQLNSVSGSSVTYTRIESGNNTLTVRDSNDSSDSASVTITQP